MDFSLYTTQRRIDFPKTAHYYLNVFFNIPLLRMQQFSLLRFFLLSKIPIIYFIEFLFCIYKEMIIPKVIAEQIGYDRLEKINNRGKERVNEIE